MRKEEVRVAGRLVLVATDVQSQTINIHSRAEVPGEYERVIRLRLPETFVRPRDLETHGFESVAAMVEYLTGELGGRDEGPRKPPYLRR